MMRITEGFFMTGRVHKTYAKDLRFKEEHYMSQRNDYTENSAKGLQKSGMSFYHMAKNNLNLFLNAVLVDPEGESGFYGKRRSGNGT